ncbi:HNH endonuclease [Ammoniphilus sp. 3BR4]|uniref:HNH endonuclease n=1 Tax=Ammoniphilus sp. 3BR4 TaxID=3158265 RepID=UPI00346621FA
MISLKKTAKPEILRENEVKWTREWLDYVQRGEKMPDWIVKRYRLPIIKEALLKETQHKCAYCESKLTHTDYGDIEHIEPKSKVPSKTFSWENLTIACRRCNQSKGDYHCPQMPLLNPFTDKPEKQIIFLGPIPVPEPGNDRAKLTIRRLKLDRAELIERRQEHITQRMMPLIEFYMRTTNLPLRQEIYKDIMALKNKEMEFSSMCSQTIKRLILPAVRGKPSAKRKRSENRGPSDDEDDDRATENMKCHCIMYEVSQFFLADLFSF